MITENIGSYSLFMQGFRDARLIDSERVLKDLRGSSKEVGLQLLRADRVAGKEHLIFAAGNAVASFRSKDRRTKHLSMELLLFASGEHQIVEAIRFLGVDPSITELVLVGLSETTLDLNALSRKVANVVKGVPDDAVMDIGNLEKIRALKNAYNISDRELNSSRMPGETENSVLKRVVIERSALLVLEN